MKSSLETKNAPKTKAQADRAEAALPDPAERTDGAPAPIADQSPFTLGNKLTAESRPLKALVT
jgi:hypothetical protein